MVKFLVLFCLTVVASVSGQAADDPTFGGVFSTPKNYIDPDEYVPPQNREDQFDWELTRTVLKSQPNNVLLSPLSVKVLLTLLAEAAGQTVESKTRKELEQVLPNDKSLTEARSYFKKVLSSIETTEEFRVQFGTRLYADNIVNINQRFSATAEHSYNADVINLDFGNAQVAAKSINDWVKQSTNGRLSALVTEDTVAKSILFLINTLYFEGSWRFPFNKTITREFNHSAGKKSSREFMEQWGNFYYSESAQLNAKILRLPYKGRRFSMFIILPNAVDGLDAVVEKLNANTLKSETSILDEEEVHVIIPKFKFDTSVNLNDITRSLGITEIFENTATFPLLARGGTSEGKLKVSNIVQKSGIVVDEKGTVAWSATEIQLVNKFGGTPKEFIAEHPFLFYIEDDTTGAKLFAGRVSDPKF